jgi:hypothetical protein
VKILFDENISPRLVARLEGAFPGCTYVDAHGLHGLADALVAFASDAAAKLLVVR